MLGRGGALLGAAAVCVLLAGGVGAAMAMEPGAQPAASPGPQNDEQATTSRPAPT
jgi:hypothetical protein